eukprot:GEMP01110671.1.p1 GENE.GEMP01110671.1~~GEMP01110671.1.p1  ORF type:complete len:118 (-),score=13.14 GEMP01110671.1:178-531(-)
MLAAGMMATYTDMAPVKSAAAPAIANMRPNVRTSSNGDLFVDNICPSVKWICGTTISDSKGITISWFMTLSQSSNAARNAAFPSGLSRGKGTASVFFNASARRGRISVVRGSTTSTS